MLHKVIKGYTVTAHHFVASEGLYWILANRRLGPETYEWLVAGLRHIDDNEWVTNGHYTLDMQKAFNKYHDETAGI